ncbi:MAG: YkgJ family cysteine cluster protein [Nanoarchaeota archaeon]|nr:YkgJ family cysteine cluster protein [Nanoarchaeota archaeon]
MKKHKLLKNPEACRTCAMCCRVFSFYDHNADGFADRVKLLKTDKIKVEESDFITKSGKRLFRIVINIPCSALIKKNGKYFCRLYGKKQRPKMCSEYPYNITDWEKRYCKGLKKNK